MATLKLSLFITFLVMCMWVAHSAGIELADTQAPTQIVDGTAPATEETSAPTETTETAFTPEDKELLEECANKFIKSCEIGRKCRQVVCPSDATSDVSVVLTLNYGVFRELNIQKRLRISEFTIFTF